MYTCTISLVWCACVPSVNEALHCAFLYFTTDIICYDDACHLRRYCLNPSRQSVSTESKKLASMEIVVDKMHMRGHIDKWCREHCDPSRISALDKVCNQIHWKCDEYYCNSTM